MILYRYLPSEFALKSVSTRSYRVSRMSALNDLFDCVPRIIPSDYPEDALYQKAFQKGMREQLDKKLGVICFCGDANNLLLWAHYGESHTGIVLGFDSEKIDADPICLWKVNYESEKRPEIFEEEMNRIQGRESANALFSAYSKKGKDWAYEEEWRLFVPTQTCFLEESGFFTRALVPSLTHVVLGARCAETPEIIKKSLNSGGYSLEEVSIFRAQPSDHEFKLDLIPV